MTKLIRQALILFFVFKFFACEEDHKKQTGTSDHKQQKNIYGLYSYYVTGYHSHCETVKHSIQLNNDSTFILKEFCYDNTTSSYPSTVKTGGWTKQVDSVFIFYCSDKTSFRVRLIDDETIQVITKKGEEQSSYPYQKDTTTDIRF